MRELMKQQAKALEYGRKRDAIALFMEMRLGKTTVAIRWAEARGARRVLVLCPDDVKDSWISELQDEATPLEEIVDVRGSRLQRLVIADPAWKGWFLCTYQSALYGPELLDLPWDALVLDESVAIRNPQAQITKLIQKKRSNFRLRAILTGYPAPEGNLDYFEQLKFVHGEFMGCRDYWSFRLRHFRQFGYDWTASKQTQERIKDAVGEAAFVMTREQAGIGSRKLKTALTVPMNKAQIDMIEDIRNGFRFEGAKYGEETKWVPVQYGWESVIAGGFSPHGDLLNDAKAQRILKLLKGEWKRDKVVVWCRYTHEIRWLQSFLAEKGIRAAVLFGQDKSQKKDFTHGRARVICAQARCGRYGLDWSCSSTAVYYSNWYDGEIRQQSEDRIVHPKKKVPVLYVDMVSEGSIDEDVVKILRGKRLTASEFMEELARRRNEA